MVWLMLGLSTLCMLLEWVCIGFGIWKGFFIPSSNQERARHLWYYGILGLGCYGLSHLFSQIGLFYLYTSTY
ncbi:hypothetical protein CON64_03560 [Bacillus pseudomycoides]|nr:hypothetical protein CON64_03560 [Bacillus pseudomycoides]